MKTLITALALALSIAAPAAEARSTKHHGAHAQHAEPVRGELGRVVQREQDAILFAQTTTIGVRTTPSSRRKIERRIVEVDTTLHSIEHCRGDGEIAGGCVPVGDVADVCIHTEDLLDHHDAASCRTFRFNEVRGEFEAVVVGGECDVGSHAWEP